jgi:Ser-tRNA(Ala) deacylase AlaX
MTKKTFWKDPYQTHLETQVTSVNDEVITLKKRFFMHFLVVKKAIQA